MTPRSPFERQLFDAYRREPVPLLRAPAAPRTPPPWRSRLAALGGAVAMLLAGTGAVVLAAEAVSRHLSSAHQPVAKRQIAVPLATGAPATQAATARPAPPTLVGGRYTGPPPPRAFAVDQATFTGSGTVVLSESRILVGDRVTARAVGAGPTPVRAEESAGGVEFDFGLRWVLQTPDLWDWQDGAPSAVAPGEVPEHQYRSTSGSNGIPADGVTVSMTRRWIPQCDVLATRSGVVVSSAPWGAFPCTFPPGRTAASYVFVQTFTESSPPAPHQIFQFQPV